jgi:hypothetical protein
MPNDVGFIFGSAFLLAGFLFLVVMFIFFHRFRLIRLRVTFLRGLIPMLLALVCFSSAFAIFDDRPDYALSWYQLIAIAILLIECINMSFLMFVIFGRLHASTGTAAMFFAGINLFMVFTPEGLSVQLSPELMAYYPVLSVTFFTTNIILGVMHTVYDVSANLKILRRRGINISTKRKFLSFTFGISTMYLTFAGTSFFVLIFQSGIFFFWGVIGCYVCLVFTFFGLYSADPSVFYLPIPLYMLIIFRTGEQAGILYEKKFTPIQSTSVQLVGPGVASIADLVQNAFQQSRHLRLFSVPGRKLLYEWAGNLGAVLIVDQETSIYRNCLRLVLKDASLLPAEKEKFDARVADIFSFYIHNLNG